MFEGKLVGYCGFLVLFFRFYMVISSFVVFLLLGKRRCMLLVYFISFFICLEFVVFVVFIFL